MTTLIIVLWRHRLNFHGYYKPTAINSSKNNNNFKLVVVGPENSITDDICVDVYCQIQAGFGPRDHCHSSLMDKVRELASNYGSTRRIIVVFEAELQYLIAKIRFELGVEGLVPDQVEQVIHMKEMKLIARRNGLMTLRQTVISLKTEPSVWLELIATKLGGFPVFAKSSVNIHSRKITRYLIHDSDEMHNWIKNKLEMENKFENEFVVEECLRDGYEFVSLYCSSGFICTIAKMNADNTLFETIRDQKPYAYEYLNVEQTRDILPGLESFVLRTIKSLPALPNSSFVFIEGFYKNDEDIQNKTEKSTRNHHVLVNFPSTEGVLLHQTNIPKRNSLMRVIWKACEGQELTSCNSLDDNVLQIFLSNPNRAQVMADVKDLIANTYIAVDRLAEKHSYCRSIRRNSINQLIRSWTTAD
ncbi:unnamed protein product [Thelazia callipaeda]|uniref:ATP-grasp domain-containing protein n=1 Tax=Thelazia callipaeda TaxID=103827 RepID=A0A0N5CMD4_THECL|nr:unnamed protein product [Thelazia callipaeda]